MNLSMPDLKRCMEAAGFTDVTTLLSSGNVAFTTQRRSLLAITNTIDRVMTKQLGRTFHTIVRAQDDLRRLLASDPYQRFKIPAQAKRVVTFSRSPLKPKQPIPFERDGAHILAAIGREAFVAYVPSPQGPVFMRLIETTFGQDVTTRTWDTVVKCAKA
jgi:uncharacterized protein (DUF1697 family)